MEPATRKVKRGAFGPRNYVYPALVMRGTTEAGVARHLLSGRTLYWT